MACNVTNFVVNSFIFNTSGTKSLAPNEQLNPNEVVFVGDSVHDSEVAKYAGCHCILIANGHEHRDKLTKTGRRVVGNIKEFAQLL